MADVRLKVNLIAPGGTFIKRGSVIDEKLIPEHLRNSTHIEDPGNREGRVLLLREANFNVTRTSSDRVRTNFPTMKSAGEVIARAEIPDGWKEGEDYKTDWTFQEQDQLKLAHSDIYRDSESYQPDAGLMRRNR